VSPSALALFVLLLFSPPVPCPLLGYSLPDCLLLRGVKVDSIRFRHLLPYLHAHCIISRHSLCLRTSGWAWCVGALFALFASLHGRWMIGKGIRFQKLALFHWSSGFLHMNLFTAFSHGIFTKMTTHFMGSSNCLDSGEDFRVNLEGEDLKLGSWTLHHLSNYLVYDIITHFQIY
jgi:hypothetical protein